MALITVVTAVRNAAALLPETIASVQAQTLRDWRYVVVDDASDDETATVAERFAADDPRIKVKRLGQSIGPYAAANLAAKGASSAYIARIDGDDVAPADRFSRQVAALRRAPWARACTGASRDLTEFGPAGKERRVPSNRNGVIKWMMWFGNNLVHSSLMIETSRFDELGGYGPERVAEDYRMWAALVRAGEVAVIDDVVVHYRRWPGQITAAAGAREQPARFRVTLDHMQQCAPGTWTLDDARDFRRIGKADACAPERGLALLDRFETAWRSDESLDDDDRHELARHTARRRVRHMRQSLRTRPAAVTFATVRRAPSILGSFTEVLTNRGVVWP